MRLNKVNLRRFSDAVRIPTYDRNTLSPGILHLSVGNFHRGHMAVYLDELFEQGEQPAAQVVATTPGWWSPPAPTTPPYAGGGG